MSTAVMVAHILPNITFKEVAVVIGIIILIYGICIGPKGKGSSSSSSSSTMHSSNRRMNAAEKLDTKTNWRDPSKLDDDWKNTHKR